MSETSREFVASGTVAAAPWPLRLAQQVFSELLDGERHPRSFRLSARRAAAGTHLSALSVDDRGLLERWLSLQLGSVRSAQAFAALGSLAAIDARLAAAVRSGLPQAQARLADVAPGDSVAA